METTPPDSPSPQTWPPEQGWPLFLAWMGGVIAVSLVYLVSSSAGVGILSPDASWKARLLPLIPALAGSTWQAWLLFRRDRVRFLLWAAMPVVSLFIPFSFQLQGYPRLIIPLAEAAILRNVRQRAWAWILASMGGVVLVSLAGSTVYSTAQSFSTKVASEIGVTGGLLPTMLHFGFMNGIWIFAKGIVAAVLAWKMPPVSSRRFEEQPAI